MSIVLLLGLVIFVLMLLGPGGRRALVPVTLVVAALLFTLVFPYVTLFFLVMGPIGLGYQWLRKPTTRFPRWGRHAKSP